MDAAYLARKMEAHRDHVLMGGATVAAGSTYAGYAVQMALGSAAVGASVFMAVAAGYTAVKVFKHARAKDREIERLAIETGQAPPPRGKLGLMAVGPVQEVIAAADPIRPDMVSAIAQRRVRAWEKTLDPNYRPPVRRHNQS